MTKGTEMKERLAELCHEQWSGWMNYLFEKSYITESGQVLIPKWAVDRWKKQCATKYNHLSEEEKDSDRKEADKILEITDSQLQECQKERDVLREAAESVVKGYEGAVTFHEFQIRIQNLYKALKE